MQSYLSPAHYDLVTPDGAITTITPIQSTEYAATIAIQNISPAFVGFSIPKEHLSFNLKSTLAQLGLDGTLQEITLDLKNNSALAKVHLRAYGKIGKSLLPLLTTGAYIGKLFAADPRRRVRNPDYLLRMFGRTDREGRPLLSLGGPKGRDELLLEKIEGRTVAYLQLQEGTLSYDPEAILGLLPTVAKALIHLQFRLRTLIQLDQRWNPSHPRKVSQTDILLVRTAPLHIRTAFGKVVDPLLPEGVHHTSANVLSLTRPPQEMSMNSSVPPRARSRPCPSSSTP